MGFDDEEDCGMLEQEDDQYKKQLYEILNNEGPIHNSSISNEKQYVMAFIEELPYKLINIHPNIFALVKEFHNNRNIDQIVQQLTLLLQENYISTNGFGYRNQQEIYCTWVHKLQAATLLCKGQSVQWIMAIALAIGADMLINKYPLQLLDKFYYQYLTFGDKYEELHDVPRQSIKLSPATQEQIAHYHSPIKMKMYGNSRKKQYDYRCFTINEQEFVLDVHQQQYEFREMPENNLYLTFLTAKEISLRQCTNICILVISHTYIDHIDLRKQTKLQKLSLAETNIKRLNLINQTELQQLNCAYSFIDFVTLPATCQLKQLHAEHAGQIKSRRLTTNMEPFFSPKQTVGDQQHSKAEDKVKDYVVCYPQNQENDEMVEVYVPKDCGQLITAGIRQCGELTIQGYENQGHYSIINSPVMFNGFYGLRYLAIMRLEIKWLIIRNCHFLQKIQILESRIEETVISRLHQLRLLECSLLDCGSFSISKLPNLAILSVKNTQIAIHNLAEFASLRVLRLDRQEMVEQARSLPRLIKFDVSFTTIDSLSIINFPNLRVINAEALECSSFVIRNLPELRRINLLNTKVVVDNICEFEKLEELRTGNQRQINLLMFGGHPERLRVLHVSYSRLKHLSIGQLTNLFELDLQHSDIKRIDLSGCRALVRVVAPSRCRVTNCCCDIERRDN